jgi:SagB-type dehydrogenase family enzyme
VPEHITWPGSYAQILRPRPLQTAQDLLERRFMSLVSKWIRAQLGQLRAVPANESAEARVALPVPDRQGGLPLMQALARRRSERAFGTEPLSPQQLSNLLWAADGINRPEVHERTAPSAMNAQEIVVYVALAAGLYRYDPEHHALELVAASDARGVTGLQDFVDTAPLDLVYVADHHRMWTIPEGRRDVYAAACAGAIMQNVYLYCASAGLATVARGLFDAGAVSAALGLAPHQHVVLTQTVGWPAP